MTYNSKFNRGSRSRPMKTSQAKKRLFAGRKRRPCVYCGKKLELSQATFDHVKPLSQGGYDKTRNGAIACYQCNQSKGRMSREQFLKKLAGSTGEQA